jgi:Holliday junction resolvasome RuvABC endonuclease subunit
MHTNPIKILAIDPGTKEIGIAMLSDGELLYYGVKTIRTRSSPSDVLKQAQYIISRLIADYEPQYLAIEKTFLIQKSAALVAVTADEIKAIAKREGLTVFEYAPLAVRKMICKSEKATKKGVAKIIALRFPELTRYVQRQTKWETLYYANMFDAIAVGLCCHEELMSRNESLGSN